MNKYFCKIINYSGSLLFKLRQFDYTKSYLLLNCINYTKIICKNSLVVCIFVNRDLWHRLGNMVFAVWLRWQPGNLATTFIKFLRAQAGKTIIN